MITRRNFLAAVGAMAGATVCRSYGVTPVGAAASSSRRRLERVGIQLYSVRTEMQKDFPGTLGRLAELGYREVEFAGYYDRTAADVRAILERNKLTAPSTHMGYDLMATGWDQALDFATAVGHEFVTIPYLDEKHRRTVADLRRVAGEFNRAAERARARGLKFAYHNHNFEFKPVEGAIPLDILLKETDPALVSFEMDVYWVTEAGADPQAYLRQYPKRFTLLHLKDSAGPPKHEQTDVGKGVINFKSILHQAFDQQHAVRHVFVEADRPADPFAFAKNSVEYLEALEF